MKKEHFKIKGIEFCKSVRTVDLPMRVAVAACRTGCHLLNLSFLVSLRIVAEGCSWARCRGHTSFAVHGVITNELVTEVISTSVQLMAIADVVVLRRGDHLLMRVLPF